MSLTDLTGRLFPVDALRPQLAETTKRLARSNARLAARMPRETRTIDARGTVRP